MRLENKVALVTGGSTGIGAAIAEALVEAGAAVVVAARREEEGARKAETLTVRGGRALFVKADVKDMAACKAMVEAAVGAFGALHIAVNSAGIGRAGKLIADEDEGPWQEVIATNLTGAFFSMKHEIPAILASGGGSIINIASIGGLIASAGQSAYQASKHGLLGLTKAAALEYAGRGLRVNAICPGPVRTDMVKRWFAMPGVEEKIVGSIPLRRIAEPREVAMACVYLASEDAAFVTGSSFVMDGGFVVQ
jgi:NAD(P)-dependent dehydrogenase (short-subunit alcohol dehydrogenase family)